MENNSTAGSGASPQLNDAKKTNHASFYLACLSLIISLAATIFAGWQSWVAKQTYAVILRQAKIAEEQAEVARQALQTAKQANSIAQRNMQLIEKQLKRAAIEEEIKRLESINTMLNSGYFSVLNTDFLKSNFEISKSKFMEQTSYFSFGEKKLISGIFDDYRSYFTSIAPLMPYVKRDSHALAVFSTFAKNITQLTSPDKINNWKTQDYNQFLSKMFKDINDVGAILQNSVNENDKKIKSLRDQLKNL